MKKILGMLVLCFAGISFITAAELTATITEIAGKVECKLPQQEWQTAKVGDVLPAGSLISTGFKSTAILKTESATLTVKPVTRLSLEDLVKSEGTTKTQMFLMAGRVKAEVTPKSGEKADFKIKSPTATASVRGTGFEFDGKNLLVDHGAVQFEAESGVGVAQVVAAGELSSVSSTGSVSVPVAVVTGGASANNAIAAAVTSASSGSSAANVSVGVTPVPELPVPSHSPDNGGTITPDRPDTPNTPDQPKPDTPELSKPDTPEQQKPDTPEPQKPDTPEQQKPDTPEQPNKPEAPKEGSVNITVGWE